MQSKKKARSRINNNNGPCPVSSDYSSSPPAASTSNSSQNTPTPSLAHSFFNHNAHVFTGYGHQAIVTGGMGGMTTMTGPGTGTGTNHLVLVLNDNLENSREFYYKIRPTTKLGKLMRYHCQMKGQNLAWTRFVVMEKGLHLSQTDTAAEIGITDGDHIMVVFHSYSVVSQGT